MSQNNPLDKLFNKLVGEGKKTAPKPKSKRAQTMSEARQRRIERTKNNILNVKLKIESDRETILAGSLRPDHIRAVIVEETCSECKRHSRRVQSLEVWSIGKGVDQMLKRMTQKIAGIGALEFYSELPIDYQVYQRTEASCPDCLFVRAQRNPYEAKN